MALACAAGFAVAGVVAGTWLPSDQETADAPAVPDTVAAAFGRDDKPARVETRTAPAAPATRSAARRSPATSVSAARTFAWPAVRGARHYRVELFRRGAKIFDARTRAVRLVVPARWRHRGRRVALRPGRYRWRVRPAFGGGSRVRYGKPVVSAALVISAGGG